jgi:rRNA-processing protein FCF1
MVGLFRTISIHRVAVMVAQLSVSELEALAAGSGRNAAKAAAILRSEKCVCLAYTQYMDDVYTMTGRATPA